MADIVKYNYGKLSIEKIPKMLHAIIKVKTVSQALEKRKTLPSLVTMKKDLGEEKTLAYVELLIVNTNEFFNIKDKMRPSQIKETAQMILEEYYFFSLLEVIYVFKEAKKGRYGEIYNSLDGSKIMKWFASYADDRLQEAERQSEQEASKFKVKDDHLRISKPERIKYKK